jgi:sugar/nucleoside kinase (ribokinase family)/fructoselysine-6-P-deglycase FrlB-like protein
MTTIMPRFDLLVIGELNADLVLRGGDVVPTFDQAEQLVGAADLVLGASGAITACGAAALGLSVAYVGVVGDDLLGGFVVEQLAARGVDVSGVRRRDDGQTGLGVHLVREDGDRAMLTFAGLISALTAGDVPAEALASARHVHVASPFLQPGLRAGLRDLLAAARDAGARTSLDPGWDPSGRFDLGDVLAHVDLFLPNDAELRRVARCEDPAQAAARIADAGPRVAVKLGSAGAQLGAVRVAAPGDAEVADAVGAGDSFNAGLIAGLLTGLEDRAALALGVASATLSLRASGGTAGQGTRAEADALAARLLASADAEAAAEAAAEAVAAAPGDAPRDATSAEIASQPATWRRAVALPATDIGKLPVRGERVLALGAGTSYYVLDAYARRRQELDGSLTRAAIASEFDDVSDYDVVLMLSRSGTTSDLLHAHARLGRGTRGVAIVGDPATPVAAAADVTVALPFADETSVVQTRFASTALALLRRSLGEDLTAAIADAEAALAGALVAQPLEFDHLVFLGTGWTLGVAHEAALKCREAALIFAEAYAIGEYQHGPVALAGERTLIWSMGPLPAPLRHLCEGTGATVREAVLDPLAELVAVHRLALATAYAKGLDPDRPRHLSRSVVLEG